MAHKSAFQIDLLWAMYGTGGASGQDLREHLVERYRYEWAEITHGRLYPSLNQLVTDGLAQKSPVDGRTNRYELTDAGDELLTDRFAFVVGAANPHHRADPDDDETALQVAD